MSCPEFFQASRQVQQVMVQVSLLRSGVQAPQLPHLPVVAARYTSFALLGAGVV